MGENKDDILLSVKDLNVFYGGIQALRGISLEVPDGKIVTLIGANGAGKSTTLRTVTGLVKAASGSIQWNGGELLGKSIDRIISEGIAMSPEGRRVFPNLTVLENLTMAVPGAGRGELLGMLEAVGLGGEAERLPGELSGGMARRGAIVRAAALGSSLALLDEPFAAIDAKVRAELRAWLREMIERVGVTSIFVTHDQEEAMEVADLVIVTNQGRVEQMGTPDDICLHPETEFVADFIDTARFEALRAVEGLKQ